ncbi:unnamed protein product [Pelagomonas calceolata]|uniref:Uncharacterized protein n=1 Tax=Pelagomonas calceolata TaxID=35677 RepID=A0A8J2SWQ8_9STRA|nr:unnamed protein product [Pelagomonas calceolata]
MTWPRWLRRAVGNRHRHAIEQSHTSQKATTATSAARQSGRQQARALFKMGPLSAGARGPGLSDWIVASEVSSSMPVRKSKFYGAFVLNRPC